MKEHKLAAIVFTDIVGYTSRMEKDEQHTMELLKKQREILFPIVKEFGGEVIKEIGDGLLMMFTSAVKAVRFAIAVQNRLADEELSIRAGIHIGDVIFEEGDVFGSAVNIAARIEPLALDGGICISEDVYSQIRNKNIITDSIGRKSLKGVEDPVEIYRVYTEGEAPERSKPVPFLKDLWHRRVFQITALYLVLALLIRMVMSFIVSKYLLSPHLVDLVWFILLSLVPSVILIAYFHGRKGITKWKRVELIGLPLNFILAILILIFVFKGKDLGAATESLTLENEDGEMVERVVLKSEFRKKIALFNFQNISSDTTYDWLQYMIPSMTTYDLSQDIFISTQSAVQFFKKLIDAGFPDGIGLPLNLMKRITDELHMNYYLVGDFNYVDDEYVLSCKLYEPKYSKLVSEFQIKHNDVFQLVDELTIKVKESMGLPANHINETPDLPITEIFTGSLLAAENFSYSGRETVYNNWPEAIRYLEIAIDEDPGFALAYFRLSLLYFSASQGENAQVAINDAMAHLDKLPERQQFFVKFLYYLFRQEADKAFAVIKMLVELYPDDLEGRKTLAERYYYKNLRDEAIQEYKAVLKIDPEQYDILTTIADIYRQMGNYDSALLYYEMYAGHFPQQYKAFTNLGAFYRAINDPIKSKENYEKALLLAPLSEKAPVLIDLADIELISGEFDKALEQYQEALTMCINASDSATVYASLQQYYDLKGQFNKALEYYEKQLDAFTKYRLPKDNMVYRVFTIDRYIKAKKIDEAFDILEELGVELEPPLDKVIDVGYMFAYVELGKTEEAEQAMVGVEELAQDFGETMMLANVYYAKGMVAETKEAYDTAIENYQKYFEFQPTGISIHRNIARCFRKLGNFKDAEDQILISLQNRPFNPENNYEAALLYLEMGENEKAIEYLQIANDIWKDADEDYDLAMEARVKLVELAD